MAQAVGELGEVAFEIREVEHGGNAWLSSTVPVGRGPQPAVGAELLTLGGCLPFDLAMAQSTIGQESSDSASGEPARVEIYTWQFCPYCIRAKALLDRKGISYSEYRIDGDQEARRQMAIRATGRTSVPQVFINNMGLGGCDDLNALERNGQLDYLLGRQA
jgi:glutaredoxin 3